MDLNQLKERIEFTLGDVANQFIAIFPDIIVSLLILTAGYLIALIVSKLFSKLFKKLRFDSASNRIQLTAKMHSVGINQTPSELVAKLFFWLIILFSLITTAGYLGMVGFVDNLTSLAMYIPKLMASLIILVVGLYIAHFARNTLKEGLKGVIPAAASLISNFVYGVLIVVIALTIMEQLSFDTGFIQTLILIAFGGLSLAVAISVGIGSAPQLKKTLASYYLKDHLKVGQEVTIGDKKGKIVKIHSSSTEIEAENGIMVVPNDYLLNQTYSKNG